ncbi:hypothetical protein AVEN_266834-1 [Araneus ventricosus]|uniref:Uncharacterized protein n=1 Tax=Araneus ventricosus TaxID=182803 RepID=A0A4Y2ML01_ARAVE|nr:hypothetical protein AVEN_266834-1 [Araneus ventricosus]
MYRDWCACLNGLGLGNRMRQLVLAGHLKFNLSPLELKFCASTTPIIIGVFRGTKCCLLFFLQPTVMKFEHFGQVSKARSSCNKFSESRQVRRSKERNERSTLTNDDHGKLLRQPIVVNCLMTITELNSCYQQIFQTLLPKIVAQHLLLWNMCVWWVPKNLTFEHPLVVP